MLVAGLKGLVAGTCNTALALAAGATMPALQTVGSSLLVGFFGYGLSLTLFVVGLRVLGTARTGAYFSVAPLFGVIVSLAIWPSVPGPLFWVAAALMALGGWLHIRERHFHDHTHEPLEHFHRHRHDEHHQHTPSPGRVTSRMRICTATRDSRTSIVTIRTSITGTRTRISCAALACTRLLPYVSAVAVGLLPQDGASCSSSPPTSAGKEKPQHGPPGAERPTTKYICRPVNTERDTAESD